jgi:hypothetical protein
LLYLFERSLYLIELASAAHATRQATCLYNFALTSTYSLSSRFI